MSNYDKEVQEAWDRWYEDPAEHCIKNCNPRKYWLSNNCDRCEEIEKNERAVHS